MATVVSWSAEHDGYARLRRRAKHNRSVRLDRCGRYLEIVDEINGGSHDARLAFHLGPDVQAELDGSGGDAQLDGRSGSGQGAADAPQRVPLEFASWRDGPHPRLVFRRTRA